MSNQEIVQTLVTRLRSGHINRRDFIKALLLMGVSASTATALAACTPAQTTPTATSPAGGATPAAGATAPAGGTAAAGGNRRGGVLRRGWQPLRQLDPAFQASVDEIAACAQIYDFFVWIGTDNKPTPALATEWEPNKEGTVWTFTMRQGVTFHNGKPLTIEDVIFTFNRLRNKDVGAPTVALYENITEINKVDDTHVQFVLARPNPDLPADLGDYHGCIVDSTATDFATTFNGTGPFIVERFSPEDRLVYRRNDNYWMEGLPYLDGIEDIYSPQQAAHVEALRGGDIDIVMGLPAELAETLSREGRANVLLGQTNQHFVIRMRSDRGPAADNRVRQALKLATDRSAILQAARLGYGVTGRDTPIGPSFTEYYLDVPEPKRDVERARQLLREAGYENLTITLVAQNSIDVPKIATVWKEQLAEAGVTVEINVVPVDVYYQDDGWLEVDFGITDWGSRATPQPYLELAYKTGAMWNETHWSDPELDSLAAQAASELDQAKRVELYHQIQQIFMERGPIIVPYFEKLAVGTAPNVRGVTVHPDYPRTTMSTVYFES